MDAGIGHKKDIGPRQALADELRDLVKSPAAPSLPQAGRPDRQRPECHKLRLHCRPRLIVCRLVIDIAGCPAQKAAAGWIEG